jgi:hypothetical protein
MSLNKEQRLALRTEMIKKNLKIKDIAEACDRSSALICMYFKNKCEIDPIIEAKLQKTITETIGFEYVKVKREVK